ncbi:murein transglycosylase domain-containing protein [Oleidesulfovibrio sp.]|uniref:murein transglycosylase domain-containing protein n=1 Tax=Oleidesulfovibrio sp. TaxID=2909707 RepID=UPI003A8AB5BA
MKKALFALISTMVLSACTVGEATRLARIAATGDMASAAAMATDKGIRYAVNPGQLETDLKRLSRRLKQFRDAIMGNWGDGDVKEAGPKEYVKYTQNYLSRASVDFDKGIVTVETIDTENPDKSLRNAIITTLLTPADPRAVDMYSAGEIKLGEEPFLYNEVLDFHGKPIRWAWRAESFATDLVQRHKTMRVLTVNGKRKTVHSVTFNMVKDHLQVRARKFHTPVMQYASEYGISPNLIYAIMQTESDFNPFAVSHAPAYGLMQVVPSTAGSDVYKMLNGRKGEPTPEQLFTPEVNIRYGTAYLYILNKCYLSAINHPVSREYCVIAAYNGGAGAVLRSFHQDRETAAAIINSKSPDEVYATLQKRLPSMETRRYLWKVGQARKRFVAL